MSSTLRQSCKISKRLRTNCGDRRRTIMPHAWRKRRLCRYRSSYVDVGRGHSRRSDRLATEAKKLPIKSSKQGSLPFIADFINTIGHLRLIYLPPEFAACPLHSESG